MGFRSVGARFVDALPSPFNIFIISLVGNFIYRVLEANLSPEQMEVYWWTMSIAMIATAAIFFATFFLQLSITSRLVPFQKTWDRMSDAWDHASPRDQQGMMCFVWVGKVMILIGIVTMTGCHLYTIDAWKTENHMLTALAASLTGGGIMNLGIVYYALLTRYRVARAS